MPFLAGVVHQLFRHRHSMPFAVHALDIADVVVLLGFIFGVGFLRRAGDLCVRKLPARQVVRVELGKVLIRARQYQNTGTTRHRRA